LIKLVTATRVCELGADLHSLSHRLHPSTLKILGLVAAVRAFCKEFEQQQAVHVDFCHEKVPRNVPEEECQAAHSGANRAEVRLECLDGRLHLAVSDRGSGFDSTKPAEQRGTGLRSMEERLRVLGGQLDVRSRPWKALELTRGCPLSAMVGVRLEPQNSRAVPRRVGP